MVGKPKQHNGPGGRLVEVTPERLPARYNTKTEWTVGLGPDSNVTDWAVESKARRP